MTNLLPLDSWRKYMGYNPFHFNGLSNSKVPVTSACNTLVQKYEWQRVDAVGRSEIVQAIESAEARLQEYLGYSVAPHYVIKTYDFPHYLDAHQWRIGLNIGADSRTIPVSLKEGYLQAVGIENVISIGDAALAFIDQDGDGILDTFTASIATTATDPDSIAVYFTTADRVDSSVVSEDWRVRPVQVTISGGTVSIRGRSYLVVKPIKYEGMVDPGIGFDPNTVTNYVVNLTIAVRTTNPDGQAVDTAQATLLWETVPCAGWWGCCGNQTNSPLYTTNINDPAAVGMAVARVGIRDADRGQVLPGQAVYDVTSAQWRAMNWSSFREPDRVTIRFLAGYPLENGDMANKWRVIVARMAAAELARPICACDVANQQLYHWQFDVSRAGGANSEQYSISPADLDNPFGTRRGHVWAWKQVRNLRVGGGTRVG